MAKGMTGKEVLHPKLGFFGKNKLIDRIRDHMLVRIVPFWEKPSAGLAIREPVIRKDLESQRGEDGIAVRTRFGMADVDAHVGAADILITEGTDFADAEPSGVHEGQDGLMLEIRKSLDKIPYLLLGRDIGKKRIKSAHRELCGVPRFMKDIHGKKAKLRNAVVYGTVRKMLFILNPADEIAQFLPGNIFRAFVEEARKIIQIIPDISGIGFYSMVCKAAKGDHLPKKSEIIVHNRTSFE